MVDDRTTDVPHHEHLSQDMNRFTLRAGARGVKVW